MNYDLYKQNIDAVKPILAQTTKASLSDSPEWRMVEMLSTHYPHLHKRYLIEEGFE